MHRLILMIHNCVISHAKIVDVTMFEQRSDDAAYFSYATARNWNEKKTFFFCFSFSRFLFIRREIVESVSVVRWRLWNGCRVIRCKCRISAVMKHLNTDHPGICFNVEHICDSLEVSTCIGVARIFAAGLHFTDASNDDGLSSHRLQHTNYPLN